MCCERDRTGAARSARKAKRMIAQCFVDGTAAVAHEAKADFSLMRKDANAALASGRESASLTLDTTRIGRRSDRHMRHYAPFPFLV